MKILYQCEYCKKTYDEHNTCLSCEMSHMSEHEKIKTKIHLNGELVCDYCEYSYYVYGCEVDCEHYDCHGQNGFKKFKPVDPLHNKRAHGGV